MGKNSLAAVTTPDFIIQHVADKDILPDIPGIPTTSLGSCRNNCTFPGLPLKGLPTQEASSGVPSQVLELQTCSLHCLGSSLLSGSPTVQTEWGFGQEQASPHSGKHKQIAPQSLFLLKGSANPRVSSQEEYHQTNGSCVCSIMKHEQHMSPGGFAVAYPK